MPKRPRRHVGQMLAKPGKFDRSLGGNRGLDSIHSSLLSRQQHNSGGAALTFTVKNAENVCRLRWKRQLELVKLVQDSPGGTKLHLLLARQFHEFLFTLARAPFHLTSIVLYPKHATLLVFLFLGCQ
ncbi:uncharacterized protein LOC143239032 [Tachypleus tridentatus]|uniref:uncharacterized protein LOC143239032 n=1 Tax=Tachypleus tridentatus TaxID=6853 RepID=UPI003FCEFE94